MICVPIAYSCTSTKIYLDCNRSDVLSFGNMCNASFATVSLTRNDEYILRSQGVVETSKVVHSELQSFKLTELQFILLFL